MSDSRLQTLSQSLEAGNPCWSVMECRAPFDKCTRHYLPRAQVVSFGSLMLEMMPLSVLATSLIGRGAAIVRCVVLTVLSLSDAQTS